MTDLHIGQWVRRERVVKRASAPQGEVPDPRTAVIQRTKGHLVESVIDGDAITRCGRRMRHLTRPSLVVHMGSVSRAGRPLDWDLCRGCE